MPKNNVTIEIGGVKYRLVIGEKCNSCLSCDLFDLCYNTPGLMPCVELTSNINSYFVRCQESGP